MLQHNLLEAISGKEMIDYYEKHNQNIFLSKIHFTQFFI